MAATKPMARVLRAVAGKGRSQRRRLRTGALYLFADTRLLGQARLVDESEGGAQISARSAHILRLATYALDPQSGEVRSLSLAWNEGLRAGYRYTAVHQIRGYVSDPHVQRIRETWASMSLGQGAMA